MLGGMNDLFLWAEKNNSTNGSGTLFFPSKCSEVCSEQTDFEVDVLDASEGDRGSRWSKHLLSQVQIWIDRFLLAVRMACI